MNNRTNLLETTLDEVITGEPDVLRGAEALERNLILIRLFQLLPGNNPFDEPLLCFDNDEGTVSHHLGLLSRDLAGSLV